MRTTRPLEPPAAAYEEGQVDGCSWMRVTGRPASIVAAAAEHLSGTAEHACSSASPRTRASLMASPTSIAVERLSARGLGFERLLIDHRQAWASRWEEPTSASTAIRSCSSPCASRSSICWRARRSGRGGRRARGLTGEATAGTSSGTPTSSSCRSSPRPTRAAARAMLEYRLRRLPAALSAARAPRARRRALPLGVRAVRRDVTPGAPVTVAADRVADPDRPARGAHRRRRRLGRGLLPRLDRRSSVRATAPAAS